MDINIPQKHKTETKNITGTLWQGCDTNTETFSDYTVNRSRHLKTNVKTMKTF